MVSMAKDLILENVAMFHLSSVWKMDVIHL